MPVIIKYVVERDGIEKMTFASKAEADAYDKLLDTADEISELLSNSNLLEDEQQVDSLSMYLAQNKDCLLQALGSKRKGKAPAKATVPDAQMSLDSSAQSNEQNQDLEDLVIEKDDEQINDSSLDIDQDEGLGDVIDSSLDDLIDAA